MHVRDPDPAGTNGKACYGQRTRSLCMVRREIVEIATIEMS
jgi:hypothetical protein